MRQCGARVVCTHVWRSLSMMLSSAGRPARSTSRTGHPAVVGLAGQVERRPTPPVTVARRRARVQQTLCRETTGKPTGCDQRLPVLIEQTAHNMRALSQRDHPNRSTVGRIYGRGFYYLAIANSKNVFTSLMIFFVFTFDSLTAIVLNGLSLCPHL